VEHGGVDESQREEGQERTRLHTVWLDDRPSHSSGPANRANVLLTIYCRHPRDGTRVGRWGRGRGVVVALQLQKIEEVSRVCAKSYWLPTTTAGHETQKGVQEGSSGCMHELSLLLRLDKIYCQRCRERSPLRSPPLLANLPTQSL
jgi:hypothetical protein